MFLAPTGLQREQIKRAHGQHGRTEGARELNLVAQLGDRVGKSEASVVAGFAGEIGDRSSAVVEPVADELEVAVGITRDGI